MCHFVQCKILLIPKSSALLVNCYRSWQFIEWFYKLSSFIIQGSHCFRGTITIFYFKILLLYAKYGITCNLKPCNAKTKYYLNLFTILNETLLSQEITLPPPNTIAMKAVSQKKGEHWITMESLLQWILPPHRRSSRMNDKTQKK